MGNKSFVEQVGECVKDSEISHIIKLNNGRIKKEKYYDTKDINDFSSSHVVSDIKWAMKRTAHIVGEYRDYNYIAVELLVGLMYKPEYYANRKFYTNAEPEDGWVAVYCKNMYGCMDNKKRRICQLDKSILTFNGFANYDELIQELHENGIEIAGPQTFEEFKARMDINVPFEIKAYIDLRRRYNPVQEEPTLTRKLTK